MQHKLPLLKTGPVDRSGEAAKEANYILKSGTFLGDSVYTYTPIYAILIIPNFLFYGTEAYTTQ